MTKKKVTFLHEWVMMLVYFLNDIYMYQHKS